MFGIKEKSIILTHAYVLLAITHIPVRLKTGFVIQGHICIKKLWKISIFKKRLDFWTKTLIYFKKRLEND